MKGRPGNPITLSSELTARLRQLAHHQPNCHALGFLNALNANQIMKLFRVFFWLLLNKECAPQTGLSARHAACHFPLDGCLSLPKRESCCVLWDKCISLLIVLELRTTVTSTSPSSSSLPASGPSSYFHYFKPHDQQ